MSCVVDLLRSRSWLRVAALAMMTIGVAACSGEASRFNDDQYVRTGYEPPGAIPQWQAVPVARVESQPLPPYSSQVAPTYQSSPVAPSNQPWRAAPSYPSSHVAPSSHAAPTYYGSASAGVRSDIGGGSMDYRARPGSQSAPDVTNSIAAAPNHSASANWSANGGTVITVAPKDNLHAIARRHGVPVDAIRRANNLTAPGIVHPGQQLVIPRYAASPIASSAPGAARPGSVPPRPGVAMTPSGSAGVHVVAPGETLSRLGRLYNRPPGAIARANNIQPSARLNVGDRLAIPGVAASTPTAKVAPAPAQPKAVPSAPRKEPQAVPSASVYTPVPEPSGDSPKTKEAAGDLPKFRWPANGRIIAGFGPKTNGQQNDGINIAVPENTPVKAAEEGVVAYAGNELKGYGNLVLVRHPNGYVTAYAHAKELMVKRGDQVKRGQVIARSGQTGNVNAPQLHFEVRKGASPLDPIKFLNGA
jgi:murein DD-endopeptidase MepM/ murein hydrolase activator NlpD